MTTTTDGTMLTFSTADTRALQVAVDTGGTFTDVAVRRPDGSLFVWKVPSTPDAPDQAVIEGVSGALSEMGGTAEQVSRFVHGTTVATNTVITRTGSKVGLLTTMGFRDLLAIAHQARPMIYDQHLRRPDPLVPPELIVDVPERIDAEGNVLRPLRPEDLDGLVQRLKAMELDVLVVSFLNSYVNPEHEERAVESLRTAQVAPSVFAASEVSREMREYERTSTGVINAYVQPKIAGYVRRLEHSVSDLGVPAKLWIMQSNGGLLSPEAAAEHSARTVLSGLAGGVVGAANWARHLGLAKVVSFDIGGTSTDIALIRGGRPDETLTGEIDELPLRLPSVDVHTIGAGGGSIAWQDTGGGLRVGPHSAGAEPGPISYSRGGTEPTVTDAHAVLGRLGSSLLGGRFTLDVESARARMSQWGTRLGLSTEDTAEGIIRVINATMARGIRKVSVERGVDVRDCDLMSFGGAGPLHGSDLIRELGMRSAVIPPIPGIASAVGMLDAPVRHDYAATVQVSDEAGLRALTDAYARLQDAADANLDGQASTSTHLVDARYVGQSYELTISAKGSWAEQRAAFDAAHEERYGFRDPDADMELVVARLVSTQGHLVEALPLQAGADRDRPHPYKYRDVYIDGRWVETPIHRREDLPSGAVLRGPVIIDQFDTTVYVRPGQICTNDEYGFLHLSEKEHH